MYRQYEDPRKLQEKLNNLREEFHRKQSIGELDPYDYEDYILEIHDLEERINFAWQDEEYDDMNRDVDDEQWMEENVYSATDVEEPNHFYRIIVGSGTAWLDSYVIETEYPTTDYGALVDILIDYMVETGDNHILDPNEYEWKDDDTIYVYDLDDVMYGDTFVQGGNAGDVMVHYGEFKIEEISEDQITENDIIIPEVW